jgi:hypothetical protein
MNTLHTLNTMQIQLHLQQIQLQLQLYKLILIFCSAVLNALIILLLRHNYEMPADVSLLSFSVYYHSALPCDRPNIRLHILLEWQVILDWFMLQVNK